MQNSTVDPSHKAASALPKSEIQHKSIDFSPSTYIHTYIHTHTHTPAEFNRKSFAQSGINASKIRILHETIDFSLFHSSHCEPPVQYPSHIPGYRVPKTGTTTDRAAEHPRNINKAKSRKSFIIELLRQSESMADMQTEGNSRVKLVQVGGKSGFSGSFYERLLPVYARDHDNKGHVYDKKRDMYDKKTDIYDKNRHIYDEKRDMYDTNRDMHDQMNDANDKMGGENRGENEAKTAGRAARRCKVCRQTAGMSLSQQDKDRIDTPQRTHRIHMPQNDKDTFITPQNDKDAATTPQRRHRIHRTIVQKQETSCFKFLSIFKFEDRKGWDVLLQAYWREFGAKDNVSLYECMHSIHACVHVHTYAYIYMCVCVYIYIYIHTHMRICAHTRTYRYLYI
jgi:hypothetical protein